MAYINGKQVLQLVIYNEKTLPIEIPTVDNVLLSNNILSWTAPNLSNLSQYNPVVSYIIKVNNTVVTEITTTSIDISSFLQDGANTVGITVKVLLTNNNETTVNLSYTYEVTVLSASLAEPLRYMASGVVGNNIYLFGGGIENGRRNLIQKFDATSETLTTLAVTLPQPTRNIASGVVGNNIYLFGGATSTALDQSLTTIQKFDAATETLTTLNVTLGEKKQSLCSATVGNNIYLFGGLGFYWSATNFTTIKRFDATSETITTLAVTLPNSTYNMASGVVGNNIYLFGGELTTTAKTRFNTIQKFDATSETLTTLAVTLPSDMASMASKAVDNNIFIFGGSTVGTTETNTIQKFDATSETLTTLAVTLPHNYSHQTAELYNNAIYLFGSGYDSGYKNNVLKFKGVVTNNA